MDILEIDLLAFETGSRSERAAVIDGVMRSLSTGFVYVRHDLSVDMIDEVYAQLEAFFTLPQERKDAYIAAGTMGQTGYTPLMVEKASVAEVADWKEMLNWSVPVPEGHPLRTRFPLRYHTPVLPEDDLPGIRSLLLAFADSVADLQRRVLRIIAEGLGADAGYFEEMLTDGGTLTRAIHYPPMTQTPPSDSDLAEPIVWAAEHADINLITALPRATASGLQVRTSDGWIDAAPPQDRAIINTGMMLERISNGMLRAAIHRVVSAPGQAGDRYSVVQFAHPTPWTILTPMPCCVTAANPLRYSSISAADALDRVLWQINLTGQ